MSSETDWTVKAKKYWCDRCKWSKNCNGECKTKED